VGVSDIASFVQTDASINPGNSGGALVDMAGRLVGINSIIFSKGGGSNGIGFAIPSEMVKRVVDAAVNGGTLVRPWIGAKGEAVTSKTAPTVGLDRPKGVLVSEVYPGSPAQKAGVLEGDVVLAVDGREVFDERNMKFVAATRAVGETIPVDLFRKGKQVRVNLLLASPPGATSAESKLVEGRNPFAGAEVLEVTPALAEQYNADMFRTGVMVNRIARRDYALKYVQPGDFIRELNGARINTVKDLEAALKKIEASNQPVWRIALERNGERIEKTVNG
jgi:serine protease Do